MGDNDFGYDDVEEIPDDVNEIMIEKQTFKISNMSNSNFRNKLVTSFHKRWKTKDIEWPSRTGKIT